jgi:hypothetical protein
LLNNIFACHFHSTNLSMTQNAVNDGLNEREKIGL